MQRQLRDSSTMKGIRSGCFAGCQGLGWPRRWCWYMCRCRNGGQQVPAACKPRSCWDMLQTMSPTDRPYSAARGRHAACLALGRCCCLQSTMRARCPRTGWSLPARLQCRSGVTVWQRSRSSPAACACGASAHISNTASSTASARNADDICFTTAIRAASPVPATTMQDA